MQSGLKKIFTFFLVLIIPACVEHTFFIDVHPAGNFDIEYHARGDRADLLDADFCMPHDSTWHLVSTLNAEDAETFEYSAAKWFEANAQLPETFFEGDSVSREALLKTPAQITRRRWLLNNTYEYRTVFRGRHVTERYPALANSFESDDKVDWINEVLTYIFRETLRRIDVGFNREPILSKQLEAWLDENVTGKADTLLLLQLDEIKQAGLELLKQALEERYYSPMDSIFTELSDEARITHDLADDVFEFRVILPGEVLDTNADTTRGDTMIWNVNLQNYLDGDYTLEAKSRVIYPWRYRILIALVVVLVLFLLVKSLRARSGQSSQHLKKHSI